MMLMSNKFSDWTFGWTGKFLLLRSSNFLCSFVIFFKNFSGKVGDADFSQDVEGHCEGVHGNIHFTLHPQVPVHTFVRLGWSSTVHVGPWRGCCSSACWHLSTSLLPLTFWKPARPYLYFSQSPEINLNARTFIRGGGGGLKCTGINTGTIYKRPLF